MKQSYKIIKQESFKEPTKVYICIMENLLRISLLETDFYNVPEYKKKKERNLLSHQGFMYHNNIL